jgi:hypothetical protein
MWYPFQVQAGSYFYAVCSMYTSVWIFVCKYVKGKVVPLQALSGLEGG